MVLPHWRGPKIATTGLCCSRRLIAAARFLSINPLIFEGYIQIYEENKEDFSGENGIIGGLYWLGL